MKPDGRPLVWEAHRRAGYFGRGLRDGQDGPRHFYEGDISPRDFDAKVGDVLAAWWEWAPWVETAPPFPGAVFEWPARVADGLAVARSEWRAIQSWQQWRHMQKQERK